MDKLLLVFAALLLSGCLDDPAINISALSKHDRFLFSVAAAIENVNVEIAPRPGQWKIRYGGTGKFEGYAKPFENGYCEIYISRNLQECEIGGRDKRLIVVGRHEIRHCLEGVILHSNNPKHLMNKNIPCLPSN